MVSFAQRHLAIMTFEVTLLDKEAPVAISSQLLNRQAGADEYRTTEGNQAGFDPRKSEFLNERVLEPKLHLAHDEHMLVGYKCRNSGMAIAVSMEHTVDFDGDVERDRIVEPDFAKEVFRFRAAPGRTFTLTKVVSYHTSRMVPARELGDRCHRTLERVRSEGVDKQFADQAAWLAEFWQRSDVEVDGDDRVQQAIRWNLFQLAQAAARGDGQGVAAKGVTE